MGIIAIHLEGRALDWFQGYEAANGDINWTNFFAGVVSRFDRNIYDSPMGELSKLKQVSTMKVYQEKFEVLMARTNGLLEELFVQCFISGLKDAIKNQVKMFKPSTLTQVVGLALLQEGIMEAIIKEAKGFNRIGMSTVNSIAAKQYVNGSIPPVAVADRTKLTSNAFCRQLKWNMQGKKFQADLRLLPLGGCDMVLGIHWLRNKFETFASPGFLQPLLVHELIWFDISMDFIEGLPKSFGKEVILVVVDRLSKYAHFLALSHPYITKVVAQLFLDNIYKLHGLPQTIVSDRDHIFTTQFRKHLFTLEETQLLMSTAYHPQTDGQTEIVNKGLEQYLRCMTGDKPKEWSKWLSLGE
ncbi:hypothetical protein EZV62_024682 [Acer yangbiense]|uniref:Integrase catalytic domain-containing protein n=1 Tax=Acer yangbiense TaxID=1000413 RepID=A0A5C7GWC8_9ROSI|nr:hypothetical protein EZV62_024682 [Acer yangbiense]